MPTLVFKGADAIFCAIFFTMSPIEVEILDGKLKLSFMDMFMGPMPILVVLVKVVFPFKVDFLFEVNVEAQPSSIEVELGIVVDAGMYR